MFLFSCKTNNSRSKKSIEIFFIGFIPDRKNANIPEEFEIRNSETETWNMKLGIPVGQIEPGEKIDII